MPLEQLTDPAAVELAIREFDRIGRTEFLDRYGFSKSRQYMLKTESGALYDSKAIAGAAYGYQHPGEGPLKAADFSGGEKTVERKLSGLGFAVARIGQDWTAAEVRLIVQDYFEMLALEASGVPYNKSSRNKQLRMGMPGRSHGSIELKHQNISAVLDELGLPFIRGYKPRSNFQELLRESVGDHISRQRQQLVAIVDQLEEVRPAGGGDLLAALVEPPVPPDRPAAPRRQRMPRKLDYAARDEQNRSLGRAGEQWVLEYERARLSAQGRPDLAARIDWVSDRLGDGTGYDIASFEDSGSDRYIEVKTTNGGALTPFVVSAGELAFSKEAAGAFFLYRVFDFASSPHVFILQGDLDAAVSLAPLDYRARLKAP